MIRVKRADLILLLVCGLAIGFGTGGLMATPQDTVIQLKPCATEDSNNCYWQADQAGNQIGASFVVIDGVTYSPNTLDNLQLPTLAEPTAAK